LSEHNIDPLGVGSHSEKKTKQKILYDVLMDLVLFYGSIGKFLSVLYICIAFTIRNPMLVKIPV